MNILAIETSCDETAIAIVARRTDDTVSVLSHVVLSQAKKHSQYGGVFPALAKREHARNLLPVLTQALTEADLLTPGVTNLPDLVTIQEREPEMATALAYFCANYAPPAIDAIAITAGPGLEPALWVGINLAKALSEAWGIPLLPINHMEGHFMSVLIDNPQPGSPAQVLRTIQYPALALLVSGGHTELVLSREPGQYELIGQTLDDAAGEAFDKVARLLDLPYPGGPEVSKLASLANPDNIDFGFPRPMMQHDNFDFSFSGLKTAVLYHIKNAGGLESLSDRDIANIAYEFESAVIEVLTAKSLRAIDQHGAQSFIVAGGVSANRRLRSAFADNLPTGTLLLPEHGMSTDNALMIALVALTNPPADTRHIAAQGNWSIDSQS